MTEPVETVRACMIVIGNEILSGRTRDQNLAYVAERLTELGVQLAEARVIADDKAAIVAAVNETRAKYDYVFTSGGIGPTHDDITADAIAEAFGVAIEYDPRAVAILEAHYEPGMLNQARMRMARIPDGAALIDNPVSRAPGFRMQNVYVFAGVPSIMQAMFEGIRHELVGGAPVLSRAIASFLPEGTVAGPLGDLQHRYPEVEIGSYPFYRMRKFGTSIVLRGTDSAQLDQAAAEYRQIVRNLGEEPIEGEEV